MDAAVCTSEASIAATEVVGECAAGEEAVEEAEVVAEEHEWVLTRRN